MALIIEDGTVVTRSQSYASYDDLVAYGRLRDVTVTAVQADGEALLLKAMDALKDRRWKGERATVTQALSWPRSGVWMSSGEWRDNELDIFPSPSNAGGITLRADSRPLAMEHVNDGKVMGVPALADANTLLRVLERKSGLTLASSVPKWKVLKR